MPKTNLKILEYHAHIYFRDSTRETAEGLHQRLGDAFGLKIKRHSITYGPRGPHVSPMIGLDIPCSELEPVLSFLIQNRGPHSVLIHPVSGHELLDHTHNALWLGTPQELDLSVLV